jgi:hypothetical protein
MIGRAEFKDIYNVLYTLDLVDEAEDGTLQKIYDLALSTLNDLTNQNYEEISGDELFKALKIGTNQVWSDLVKQVSPVG